MSIENKSSNVVEVPVNNYNKEFIFHSELRSQLDLLLNNPENIPSPLCFYGESGVGKTSFAKYLAESVSSYIDYYDMNKHAFNSDSNRTFVDEIFTPIASGQSILLRDASVWREAMILDEWQSMTKAQQNVYNVPFEEYSMDNKTLFILCVNIAGKKSIKDILTPAIYSRCHCISFNTDESKLDEVKDLVMKQYPELPEDKVVTLLPDMRKVKSAVKLAKVA